MLCALPATQLNNSDQSPPCSMEMARRVRAKMWSTSLRTNAISYILSLRQVMPLDTTAAQGYGIQYSQRRCERQVCNLEMISAYTDEETQLQRGIFDQVHVGVMQLR